MSSTPPPPLSSPAGCASTTTITSPSSLCSGYDELNPALDFFALNAAAGAGATDGSGSDGSNSNSSSGGGESLPFVPSVGDDRFPRRGSSSGGGGGRASRKRPRDGRGGEAEGEGVGGEGKKKAPQQQPRRRPPTHFVAVRIDREEVGGLVFVGCVWVWDGGWVDTCDPNHGCYPSTAKSNV